MKYAFIRDHKTVFKVSRMCNTLSVSAGGYYDWLDRPESDRAQKDKRLKHKIERFYTASRRTYGSPRIHQDLVESGDNVGVNRVAKIMKVNGIQSKMAKRFVVTTDSKNTMKPALDLLKRDFDPDSKDSAWVSDTTFIKTRCGWLYLAIVLDLFSRKVIGWSMSNKNNAELVHDALTMAVWRRGKVKEVIVHSDQGSTYASGSYQKLLRENELVCSMSRKGECLDNAVAESFFGTLKTELVDDEDYRSHKEAKQSLFEYIEVFYNRKRRHSFLGYLNPEEYEAKHAS